MKISLIQSILIYLEFFRKSQNYHKNTTESTITFLIKHYSKYNRETITNLLLLQKNSLLAIYLLHKTAISLFIFSNIKEIVHKSKLKHIFNDPYIDEQWYFTKKNRSQKILSHELENIWERNITGNGVIIGIIGHGFDPTHPDLRKNYVSQISYNFVENSFHITTSNDGYTTVCAGLTSAVADNKQCGVGGAPSSKFAILQVFDIDHITVNHTLNKKAIIYYFNVIKVYTIQFIPEPLPDLNLDITIDFILAVELGKRLGRWGLGSIYIAGGGSRRDLGNNCAFYAYQQLPYILVIGSITNDGNVPIYSEKCNAIVAAALNSYSISKDDLLYSTISQNKCGLSGYGTCSSVSIAASIIALLIEDNPDLTSRQIMVLIILTSTQYDINSIRNQAGFRYSYSMGFGMLNSNEMIRSSRIDSIIYLAEEHVCQTPTFKLKRIIKKNSNLLINIYTSGCLDKKLCVTHIEQVFLTFSIETFKRKSIRMYLTSPSGTKFYVLEPRIHDNTWKGFHTWTIKIMGFYGEIAAGIWKLEIYSDKYFSILSKLKFKIHGTCLDSQMNLILHSEFTSNHIQQLSMYSIMKKLLGSSPKNTNSETIDDESDLLSSSFEKNDDILCLSSSDDEENLTEEEELSS